MSIPRQFFNFILEWVFDTESCEWAKTVTLRNSNTSGSSGDESIEFVWSMYVTGKCKCLKSSDCPCLKRAKCVFEAVLRQSTEVGVIWPFCSKLKELCVWHNSWTKENSGNLTLFAHLSKLNELSLWDRRTWMVYSALASGGSAAAMCFVERFLNVTNEEFHQVSYTSAVCAAENGHVHVLDYLRKRGLTSVDNPFVRETVIQRAASRGHVDVLSFMHVAWQLTAEDARANDNFALRQAACHGHVNVLALLHGTFGLTAVDARADDNWGLRQAARNGHVNVLDFLRSTWGLTLEDALFIDKYAS